MANNRSSSGDPAKTLALLWRRRGESSAGRGPKPSLTLERIIEAATALADEHGLDALTMRAVAAKLSVTPMSLYTYVPGKAELLDLMLDAAYEHMPRTKSQGPDWRDQLRAIANDNRALLARHPWMTSVASSRPTLGPGLTAKYDFELRALDGLGLGDVEMDAALTFLLGFVEANARAANDDRATQRDSAMSDQEWWAKNEPLLARMFDPSKYPLASRVGAAAGAAYNAPASPSFAYEFGLARVLDGLNALTAGKETH